MNYKTHFFKAALVLLGLIVLSSCTSRKKLIYFQGLPPETEGVTYKNTEVLKVNDLLEITILSEDMNAAQPFNSFSLEANSSPQGSGAANNTPQQNGPSKPQYLIRNDGTIDFPRLGKLQVAGMSLPEVETMLQEKLAKYLKDARVATKLVNFKVTFLGEFISPGVIEVPEGRITIIEALAKAGGVTYFGKRDNVLLIRSVNGTQQTKRIDLTKPDLFKSEYFYLQQNDVVLAEPNGVQAFRSGGTQQYLQLFTLVISLGLSLFLLFNRN